MYIYISYTHGVVQTCWHMGWFKPCGSREKFKDSLTRARSCPFCNSTFTCDSCSASKIANVWHCARRIPCAATTCSTGRCLCSDCLHRWKMPVRKLT